MGASFFLFARRVSSRSGRWALFLSCLRLFALIKYCARIVKINPPLSNEKKAFDIKLA
jgi:hypothetical protein